MTGFEMPTVHPYQPPMCRCGHPAGDHKSAGTLWPHPPRFGVCQREDCACREFVERNPEPPEAA